MGKSALNLKLLAILIFIISTGVVCHTAKHHFTLVNSSDRTITIYMPRTAQVSNKELFDRFKRENLNETEPLVFMKVLPDTLYYDTHYTSFDRLFATKDGLMHLAILDVDSIAAMCKKTSPDSSIINSIVLRQLSFSKQQLENRKRIIVYRDR